MNWKNKLQLSLSTILCCSSIVFSQDFRGLRPIESSCSDAENVLGEKFCGKQEVVKTIDGRERYRLVFTTAPCQRFFGIEFKVPIGTLILIERVMFDPPRLEELGINVNDSEFSKHETDIVNQFTYKRKSGGLEMSLSRTGRVDRIAYYPSVEQSKQLKCKKAKK